MLLHDEVYVKKTLLYHDGEVFGRAVNNSSALAETVLGQMLICLHGGPKFMINMVPVANLNANFLYGQSMMSIDSIENASGKLKAVICDGNRTNQACFKQFEAIEGKPCRVHGVYFFCTTSFIF